MYPNPVAKGQGIQLRLRNSSRMSRRKIRRNASEAKIKVEKKIYAYVVCAKNSTFHARFHVTKSLLTVFTFLMGLDK